jgi:hypothetical protein
MNPNLAMLRDGKKFMWDGQLYQSEMDASHAADTYRKDNFEVMTVVESGTFLLYTRRSVKEIVVTAQ